MTRHAVDEMAEDGLGLLDVECAVLDGGIVKTGTGDPRGSRYTIVGLAQDGKIAAKKESPARMEQVPVAPFA